MTTVQLRRYKVVFDLVPFPDEAAVLETIELLRKTVEQFGTVTITETDIGSPEALSFRHSARILAKALGQLWENPSIRVIADRILVLGLKELYEDYVKHPEKRSEIEAKVIDVVSNSRMLGGPPAAIAFDDLCQNRDKLGLATP